MQLPNPEDLERINYWLLRDFGRFENGEPNWRIVYSDDQYEKRLGDFIDRTSEGVFIREVTEVREVPKYPYIKAKYVLERLLASPSIELTVNKLTYEPVWTFEDEKQNWLPPNYGVAKFVIETVYQQAAKAVGVKYKDPYSDPKTAPEVRKAEVDKIIEELYGNETAVGDALSIGEAIVSAGITPQNVKEDL